MAFIQVNGTRLYYQCFGEDSPGHAPIVLIHGSTGTGLSNWRYVAPLLGRKYRVIVPDCRGHGQSENPHSSYSFKEMAADIAEMVAALGYPRVHIIGHSNGGNVALVTLLEHSTVVQTAILQAANAFVSPDLVAREPGVFDPERVEREAPEWMREMITLHSPTHGPDYWRSLLQMTLRETIREPNYTAADLEQVSRPALVIMGEEDRVNAPARHAQFIAEHIPAAELWIPAGAGHNVHDEMLFPWIERVLDFLDRRGTDANETLFRLGRDHYPDRRLTIFQVSASWQASQGAEGLLLSGRVLAEDQRQAALAALPGQILADEVQLLLKETATWALVKRGVTDLRREPGIHAERVSQALFGEVVRVLEDQGEWALVRLEHDGYLGWIQAKALHLCSREEAKEYRASTRDIVVAEHTPVEPPQDPSSVQCSNVQPSLRLPFGVAVHVLRRQEGSAEIELPGTGQGWVAASALLPVDQRPRPGTGGVDRSLALFRCFLGVPYLWGGRTPFGFDCSGFAQAFLGFLGVNVPRDADQQYEAGKPMEGTPQPGDLLFFDQAKNKAGGDQEARSITHVAVSLGGEEIIHANGTTWSVACNSLAPDRPDYNAWLHSHLVGVRRFL